MSLMFTLLPHVCPYLPIDHLSILSLQGRRLQEAPWLTGLCLVSTGWYPPTSPVARVTDVFSLPKHSVSISVTSHIGERERGRVGETQIYGSAKEKKKVYSECSFMFISEAVSHITLCSTPILHTILWLEHELTWAEKAGQCLQRPVYDSLS